MEYGFVYIWRDRKYNRYYLGCHLGTEDDGYICSSTNMKHAYKRRPQDFKRRILKRIYTNKHELLEEEYRWLKMIKPEELKIRYYNLHNHHFGHWSSVEQTRKSIGERCSERQKNDPNWASWNKGLKRSDETKQKIREARANQVFTDETRQKLSEATKGEKNPFYGKTHSDEAKQKNRLAHLGKSHPHTEDSKLKLKELNSGSNNPQYGKKFYNNGTECKQFIPGSQPIDWQQGRLTPWLRKYE